MNDITTPIQVDQNSVPKVIMTAVQYLVTMGCSYALGKGWVNSDTVAQIALSVPPAVAFAYGIYKTWKHNEEKKVMEPYAPPEVAVKKGAGA